MSSLLTHTVSVIAEYTLDPGVSFPTTISHNLALNHLPIVQVYSRDGTIMGTERVLVKVLDANRLTISERYSTDLPQTENDEIHKIVIMG